MEDRETARMREYGESKTTRNMMATVPHLNSGLGLRKFQADGFLLTQVCCKYLGRNFLSKNFVVSFYFLPLFGTDFKYFSCLNSFMAAQFTSI